MMLFQAFSTIFCLDGDGFKKTYSYEYENCNIPHCPEREQMCNVTPGLCRTCDPDCSQFGFNDFRERFLKQM